MIPSIAIQINGKPEANGIQVQIGHTYVTYIGISTFVKFGVIPEHVMGQVYLIDGIHYTAVLSSALEPFFPWSALGHVIPQKIPLGWNFEIVSEKPSPSKTTINGQTVVAVLHGHQNGNQFYFPATVNGVDVNFMLDTGALELEITEPIGTLANCQKGNPITLTGVGGGLQEGYNSIVTLNAGGHVFTDVPCFVLGSVYNLLGNTFLNSQGLDVLLSNSTQTAYLLKGVSK